MSLVTTDLRQAIFQLTDPLDGRGHATVGEILDRANQFRAAGQHGAGAALLRATLAYELGTLCESPSLFTDIFLAAFGVGAMDIAGEAVRRFLGLEHEIAIDASETYQHFNAVMRWDMAPDRNSRFTFHTNLARLPQGIYFMVLTRWIAMLPLFRAYVESRRPAGRLYASLGDEAHFSGLAFCSNNDGNYLIPDPNYLTTGGYRGLREHCATKSVPWDARRRAALWRGTSTGSRAGDIMTLPRVQLCLLGRTEEGKRLLDAGLTDLVQLRDPGEGELIKSAGLMRPFVRAEDFQTYRYQIDIDGNTNSWPGLMQKLLSGSPVLKIASPGNWRQWYYPKLRPWENYVPVASDASDLIGKLRFLMEHDDIARRIGEAGQRLAFSLDYDDELTGTLAVMEAAMASEAYRRSVEGEPA